MQVINMKSLFVMSIISGNCNHSVSVDENIAYLGHFTKLCSEKCKLDDVIEEDETLLRYQNNVIKRVSKISQVLKLNLTSV